MLKKFTELFYDMTIGLAKQYQQKTLDLAKLEAASIYLKAIQFIHRQVSAISVVFFLVVVAAVGIVVVPVTLVLMIPLSTSLKAGILGILGIIYVAAPLAILNRLLSQKMWMEFTKSNEILEKVLNGNGRNEENNEA